MVISPSALIKFIREEMVCVFEQAVIRRMVHKGFASEKIKTYQLCKCLAMHASILPLPAFALLSIEKTYQEAESQNKH